MGNRKLKFRTTGQEKAARSRKVWTIFWAVFLVLVLASLSVVGKNLGWGSHSDKDKLNSGATNMKEHVNVLIGGTSEDGTLLFVGRFHVDTKDGSMKVKMFDPMTRDNGKSYANWYAGDGATGASPEKLAKAVGGNLHETIDRYVLVEDIDAANVSYAIGMTNINLPKDLNYSSKDYSLHLSKGKQDLNGADMFNYIRYCGMGRKESGYHKQAKLVAEIINQALNPDNAENGQSIYENVSDDVQTDISISDYMNYSQFMKVLSKMDHSVSIG